MRKHLLIIFQINLACFIATAGFGQVLNEPPHAGILRIDESGFPENIMEVFIYEPGILPAQSILKENLTLMKESEEMSAVQRLEKLPEQTLVEITMLIDSRIAAEKKELIRNQHELLSAILDINLRFFETNDFVERKGRRERRRADIAADTTISPPAFPFLDSLAKSTTSDITNLNIIFLNECIIHANSLSAFLAEQGNRNYKQWFAFYFIESADCHLISLPYIKTDKDVDNLLFSRIFNDSIYTVQMVQTLGALKNSHYRLHFSSAPVKNLESDFTFKMKYQGVFMDDQSEFFYSFPKSLVEVAFVNHILSTSDSLKHIGEYNSAHYALKDAYNMISDPVFRNAGKELIETEAKKILEGTDYNPYDLLERAELFWGFVPGRQNWLLDLETVLLKDYYHKTGKFQQENRLALLTRIYGIDPADFEFRDYYYHELGDVYMAENQFQQAAEAYLTIYEAESASQILKDKLIKALKGAFPEQYRQLDWSGIYELLLRAQLPRNAGLSQGL
jgi:hypothetical protein